MKKLFYIAFGLCAIMASCAKEIDPIPAENPGNNEKTVLPANIPASLTALYAEEASQNEVEAVPKVKTSYGSDGSFSWVLDDEVALYFVDNLDAPENQGWISYEASTVNGATATFTVKDGQTAKATALSEYKNTGLAIYPTSIARPASANSESCSTYGSPFVTVKSTVSGNASDIILIGSADATPVFHFKTAMGVLKVTITGIPAQATALQLISNDQDSYPLCGDFKLNIDGDLEIKKADYLKYYGDHTGADKLTIDLSSEGDIASRDFYFNIPTGNYAKGAFTIKIVDGSGNALLEKTLNKAFEFERNDLVSTPSALANEWVTLGVGRFIDNFLWSKITSDGYNTTIGKDVPGYVNVTIQQNASNPNTFRLINPYGNAATQFSYTSTNEANRDKYFVFTVSGFSQGSAVTNFETHRTGFAIDSGHANPELVYATTYDSGLTASNDKVVLGGETAPKIVQMAPIYRYNGSSTAYAYSTHLMNRKGVFRIIFPGVTNIGGSLSLPASGDAQLNKLEVVKESNSFRFRGVVSQYTDYEIASPNVNSYYIGNWPGVATGANGTCTWNNTGLAANTSIPTGPVYLTWYTVDSDSYNYVYDQGRTKVYFINKTDYDKYVKSHTFHYGETSAAGPWKYGTIEFGLSDDPIKGQLILKDVDGMTSVAANTRLADAHPLWTAMGTWLAHGTGDYAYSADRVTDGNTHYGIINNNRLSFATRSDFEFFNYSVDGVSGHTAKVIIFSNDGSTSDSPEELAFDISASALTLAHDYMVARWIGYFWNGSTVTNSGGRASKPLAQKDGDQRPYISLESLE